jgi:hypothetical protein
MKWDFFIWEECKMREEENRSKLLNELFKVSKMGMEASEIILPRIQDKNLRNQIKKQDENYIGLLGKAGDMLRLDGERPSGVSRHVQRLLRGSIAMKTSMHRNSPQHIAELMVNGSVKGIVSLTKALNHTPDCDEETKRLAEDYLRLEERNIDTLKKFL